MLNTPNSNVKLTLENIQQEAEIQGRLSVLQSEITNATKILRGTKMEIDRAIKEKSYQEDLLKKTLQDTEKATNKFNEILVEIKTNEKTLNDIKKESVSIRLSQDNKSQELSKREKDLVENETNYSKNNSDFVAKNEKFLKDVSDFKKSKKILLEVINSIVW